MIYADHIAAVWAAKYREDVVSNGGIPHSDTMLWFRKAVRKALKHRMRRSADQDDIKFDQIAWFSRFMAPFAGIDTDRPGLAISLDRGTDLRLTEDSETIRKCAGNVVAKHSAIYIDIPEGGYMLPGNFFQVRALFIRRFREGNRFCAVLTRPGSKHGWRFAWLEGHHGRSEHHKDFGDVWAMSSYDICDRYRPINPKKIDFSEFAEVEKMGCAALAQWRKTSKAEPENDVRARPPASTAGRARPQDVDDQPIAQEEVFTLFKKNPLHRVRIGSPRIAKPEKQRSTSKKPRAAHDVEGFLRSQPYGPGNKLRRPQWIDGYPRGSGPRKTPLNSVRPNVE